MPTPPILTPEQRAAALEKLHMQEKHALKLKKD
jgi:hypothetical protein